MRYQKPHLTLVGSTAAVVLGDEPVVETDRSTSDGGDPDLGKPEDIVAGLDA